MIKWIQQHIGQKQLVLLLSLMVGILSAIAAYLLKLFIHLIQYLINTYLIAGEHYWWLRYLAAQIHHQEP